VPSYPIDVRVDPRNAAAGSQRVRRELRGVRTEASALQKTMLALFAGAGVSVAISRSVTLLADFSQQMSTVKAITQATETQFVALQATAETLGRTTRFSASQAAEGMAFLARAGFDADQVLGAIGGTLNLAQAGGLGLGSAADIASNALQGMRLEVDQTGRVVDVFALAANSSNTNVQQLGNAMSFVAPIASGLSVGLEETTAAIGALSDAGIQGSSAGTGLRRVLTGLENPSKEAARILRSLGITTDDVKVSSVGLSSALSLLSERGLTTSQALEIFGDRGGPAAEVLLQVAGRSDGARSALDEMTRSLENAGGTAERIAETMDDNLNGAILSARSALEGLILSIGNAGATDALTATFDGLATAFRFAADNADILLFALIALSAQATAPAFVPLITQAHASTTAFLAKTAALRGTTVAMIAAQTAARGLGASLLAFAAANPILLGIAAIAGAYVLLRDKTKDTGDEIQRTAGILADYRSNASAIQRDTELLASRNEDLSEAILETGSSAQEAARLEIDAISKRLARNKDLQRSYEASLRAQLAVAKATQSGNDQEELSRLTGVSRTTRREINRGNNTRIVRERRDEAEFLAEANSELENQIDLIIELQKEGETLTENQVKILEFNAQRKEDLNEILGLEDAINQLNKPTERDEGGGGGGGGDNDNGASSPDFEERLRALQKETEALGLNERAREARNKLLDFEKDLERDLKDGRERNLVVAEIARQQTLLDAQAIEDRVKSMTEENSLLSLNTREAEARSAVLELEREILRRLTPAEEDRVRSLVAENQALRDSSVINDRLDSLAQQAELYQQIGIEAEIATEILRLENQLQRELTDTEAQWIRSAIELNDELDRRRRILEDARSPAEEAIRTQNTLNDLYRDGALSLGEYNRALQENSLANQGREIDRFLNSNGGNLEPSAFEQNRIDIENQTRAQEGGGLGQNPNEFGGFSGESLGVQDELQQERDNAQERLNVLRELRDAEILQEEEFLLRKEELFKQSGERQEEILRKGAQVQLAAAESTFSSITDILASTVGEQSALYKASFAAQKAAAIAQSIVAIQTGLAQAAAIPFPANLPAIATVAAATASIVSNIQSVRLKLMDGGQVGERFDGVVRGAGSRKSDSIAAMLSRDEFVVQADNAQQSLRLLNAINDGQINDESFTRNKFMNGGRVGGPPSNAGGFAANDRSGGNRGGSTITVQQINVEVNGGGNNAEAQGREAGEAAGRAFIETVIREETNLPGGVIYERVANG